MSAVDGSTMAPDEIKDWALKRMSDNELNDLLDDVASLVSRLADVPLDEVRLVAADDRLGDYPAAAQYVAHHLLWSLKREAMHRIDVERDAETALDYNGHRVYLFPSPFADVDDGKWIAGCSCDREVLTDPHGRFVPEAFVESRDKAIEVGDQHIAETGGAWDPRWHAS